MSLCKYVKRVAALVLSVAAFAANPCLADERGGVLFYDGFDQGKDADYAAGNPKAEDREGGGSLTASGLGKRDKALKTGAGEGFLEFSTEKNILPERGSIEFWMMPENWHSGDKKEHVIIEVQGAKGGIRFREIGQGVQDYVVRSAPTEPRDYDDMTPTLTSRAYGSQFAPQRWTHYVLTWEKDGPIGLYIGGFDATQWSKGVKCVFPGKLDSILIGERTGAGTRTWIDEVYIYDRPLTYAEAQWAATHWNERQAGTDIPRNFMQPRARVVPHPKQKELLVEVDTGARIENFSGSARLEPASGTQPAAVRPKGVRFGEAVIPFDELAPGQYKVVVSLADDKGAPLGEIETALSVPEAPVWMGNRIGISDTPPPPFTPMSGSEKEILCWGRRYALGELGLPSQINVLEKDILAGPVEFRITDEGGNVLAWDRQGTTLKTADKVQMNLESSAQSVAGRLTATVTAEYDGLIRYDLELAPEEAVRVKSMELVFPLKSEFAKLYGLEYFSHGRGALPAGEGVIKSSTWQRSCWLGDDERGLFVFNEKDEAVDHRNPNLPGEIEPRQHGFRIERSGDAARMIWSFALKSEGRALAPGEPWKFTFGVQATPVKDLSDKWRHYRLSGPGANLVIRWPSPAELKYYSPPVPLNPESYKARVQGHHDKRQLFIPYSALTWLSRGIPEYQWWQAEWGTGADSDTSGDVAQFATGFSQVRPTPEFIDFIVWFNEKLNREYDMDGIYIDWTMVPFYVYGAELGFGYVRDGVEHPGTPYFAVREIYKRVYTMLKAQRPDKIMFGHTSGNLNPSLFAFIDINLPGEGDWQGQLRDNYLEVVPLDVFRTCLGHQYGAIPMYLPQWYGASLADKDVASRQKNGQPEMVSVEKSHHLFGIGLLHDFNFWPICGMNGAAAIQFYGTLDAFGIQDAEFFGYWNNSSLIGGQTEEVKVSAYRKPAHGEPRSLLVVYNTSRETREVTLEIEWQKWMARGYPDDVYLHDAYTFERLKVDGNRVTVEVPPLNYRLLLVR